MTALESLSRMADTAAAWVQRNKSLCWLIGISAPLTLLVWGVYDRDPPVRVFAEQGFPIPVGRPGGEILFSFPVDRDLDRGCSLRVQRWIVDSAGERRDYGPPREVSKEGIALRDKLDPDRLRIIINVPPTVPPGRSHLLTEAEYTCPRNLTTFVYPIHLSLSWAFDVLPPLPRP